MFTWAKIGLALLGLLQYAVSWLKEQRTRKEVIEEFEDIKDEVIKEAERDNAAFDKLSPDERERLRNEQNLYRD